MRILILKPSSLGDVVQALPVLRHLKRWRPDAEVYWWLDRNLVPLLESDPDLKAVIPFERKRWASPRHWPELAMSVRFARSLHFDWVIDLQGLARSGMFAWLANGALTIGVDDPREGARGLYDLIVPRKDFHTHAVDWYLGVLDILKVPCAREFEWIPVCDRARESVRCRWPVTGRRFVLVQPGARWSNKRWPIESFAGLVRSILEQRPDIHVGVLGGGDDRPWGRYLRELNPDRCWDLTGVTSLREMVEWIRMSELLVTNDTGPMHVAAALGKPVVAVFGPTEPRRTGPYRHRGSVLQAALPCIPCLSPRCRWPQPMECLGLIGIDAVLAETLKWIPSGAEFSSPTGGVLTDQGKN